MFISVATMNKDVFKVRDITNPKHSLMYCLETMSILFMEPALGPKCDAILSGRYSSFPSHFNLTMLVF